VLRAYGDGNLFGEQFGENSPRVLFLHGWRRQLADFEHVGQRLANGGTTSVALDLPGFGASVAPKEAGGARHYAQLLLPAVQGLASEPLVLVGHSFGGRVATVLAAQHPELFRGLVLTGVPLLRGQSNKKTPLRFRSARWLHRRGWLSEARMEKARQRFGSSDYRSSSGVMRGVLVASANEDYEVELRQLHIPVRLVWGELDAEAPLLQAQRAMTMLGGDATLTVLEGASHFVPTENADDLVRVIEQLL
jgi:pimeloyl-ACP methyl ester carboxylesterase